MARTRIWDKLLPPRFHSIQEIFNSQSQVLDTCLRSRAASSYYEIELMFGLCGLSPSLPEEPFHAVAPGSLTEMATNHEPHLGDLRFLFFQVVQSDKRMIKDLALAKSTLKARPFGERPFHYGLNRQPRATLPPAIGEHSPACLRAHTRTKAVGFLPFALVGLIGTLHVSPADYSSKTEELYRWEVRGVKPVHLLNHHPLTDTVSCSCLMFRPDATFCTPGDKGVDKSRLRLPGQGS